MTQDTLFLLAVTVTGMYALRGMLRLAPLTTELPMKTLVATLLSAFVTLAGFFGIVVGDTLRLLTLIVGPLYVFAPLAVIALGRARRYAAARGFGHALYWSAAGRGALDRLLAQAALQQGDADAALELIPESDPLMLAQAHALRGEWREVLALELPPGGDNVALGEAARVQALLELGRVGEAEGAVAQMRARFEAQQGPLAYRSLQLSEARLSAELGDVEAVRTRLQEPLPNVPAYVLFGILARAAERAGRLEPALQLYAQAYTMAPIGAREGYAELLRSHGQPLPEAKPARPTPVGTYALTLVLVAAYGLQLLLDARLGTLVYLGQRLDASTVAGAFLLNVPGVPETGALWRYLSYAFVHANLVHIGFNAWVLFDIGRLYEARRNWGNLLASFVLGSIMGAYITAIAQSGDAVVLVGASGGVLGVAGALLADVLRSRSPADRMLSRSLLQWMALIALLSVVVPNVSLWGHVGGLVGGMLWGFARQGLPRSRLLDRAAGAVSLALIGWVLLRVGLLVAGL